MMDIPEDTHHDGAHRIGACRIEGVLDSLQHHIGREGHFLDVTLKSARHGIILAGDTHEIEMTVQKLQVNLLGLVIDADTQRLIGNFFRDLEQTACRDCNHTIPLALRYSYAYGQNILLIRSGDTKYVVLYFQQEIIEDIKCVFGIDNLADCLKLLLKSFAVYIESHILSVLMVFSFCKYTIFRSEMQNPIIADGRPNAVCAGRSIYGYTRRYRPETR